MISETAILLKLFPYFPLNMISPIPTSFVSNLCANDQHFMQLASQGGLQWPCCGFRRLQKCPSAAKYDENGGNDREMPGIGALNAGNSGLRPDAAMFLAFVIACGGNTTLPPAKRATTRPAAKAA
ncbi:hypothetical protein [Vogesella sp. AC12]|uniref:hypothetical protein n=1 Tax=Vogesella sp. AC12 TaxID=2950550 RepID=UPI00210DEDA8|nr:hypothetical protein [Vogesella sp. AC12]MCQ4143555.1 hypothetical protein [Vogesella sp. AC12]